jgi:hypothetical protein
VKTPEPERAALQNPPESNFGADEWGVGTNRSEQNESGRRNVRSGLNEMKSDYGVQ